MSLSERWPGLCRGTINWRKRQLMVLLHGATSYGSVVVANYALFEQEGSQKRQYIVPESNKLSFTAASFLPPVVLSTEDIL